MKSSAYFFNRFWPCKFQFFKCYRVEVNDYLLSEFHSYDVDCSAYTWLTDYGYDVSDLTFVDYQFFGSYVDVYLYFVRLSSDNTLVLSDLVVLRCKVSDYE